MALVAHEAWARGFQVSSISIPRPGRRAFSLTLGVTFVLLLIDAVFHARAFFDLWTLQAIQRLDAPGLHGFFEVVERLTASEGAVASWAVALVLFAALRWWAPLIALGLMPIGGVINEGIGTFLVERSRPHLDELTRTSSNWEERSFPSGHVMGAVLFYGLLFVVARRIERRLLRLAIQSASVVVIATMGIERVWEGAHWPTDVLGAYALGGLLLIALLAVYHRVDAAVAGLPLLHAQSLPHDDSRPHAHALTSLVLFNGDRVAKLYAPGFLPRALYWLAYQAPFPYVGNRAALEAAKRRRNLAAMLSEYWFGERRVARVLAIETIDGRPAVVSERINGSAPTNRKAAKAFLTRLRLEFERAGLPTWQINPRQPRAVDNVLETADGAHVIVDLESGLVSPLASLKTWGRALRRGTLPLFDEVDFALTRDYLAREEPAMRAAKGDVWFTALLDELDAANIEARAWHASEPRLWNRIVHGVVTGFGVTTWPARFKARTAGGRERAQSWMDKAVATWHTEERITAAEAETLRAQMAEPTFQTMLPYLGAHVLISIPLRFPFGSIVRPIMVLGALATATARLLTRKIDRDEWRRAWSIHSPLVILLAAVPGFGSFAYLAAKPVRANRLLLRALTDAAMQKVPWGVYERVGLRRFVARPVACASSATVTELPMATPAVTEDGPAWELAWAARPRPLRDATPCRTTQPRPVPAPYAPYPSPTPQPVSHAA